MLKRKCFCKGDSNKYRTKKLKFKSKDSKQKQLSRKLGNTEECAKSENINSKVTITRHESDYDQSTNVKLEGYCHWIVEVVDSVEDYTHEEILNAELKLIELDDYLQPEKLKLGTLDIKSAKLLRKIVDMLKHILQDRFRKVISSKKQ